MIRRIKKIYRQLFTSKSTTTFGSDHSSSEALTPLDDAMPQAMIPNVEKDQSAPQGKFFISCRRSATTEYCSGQEMVGRVVRATVNGLDVKLPNGEVGFVVKQEINWMGQAIEYKPGAIVNVVVLSFKTECALFLSIRKFQHDKQFDEFVRKLQVGDKLTGHVKTIKDYGVFVAIGPGVDALLHRTAVTMGNFTREKIGQPISVCIASVDLERKRIQLELPPI